MFDVSQDGSLVAKYESAGSVPPMICWGATDWGDRDHILIRWHRESVGGFQADPVGLIVTSAGTRDCVRVAVDEPPSAPLSPPLASVLESRQ